MKGEGVSEPGRYVRVRVGSAGRAHDQEFFGAGAGFVDGGRAPEHVSLPNQGGRDSSCRFLPGSMGLAHTPGNWTPSKTSLNQSSMTGSENEPLGWATGRAGAILRL